MQMKSAHIPHNMLMLVGLLGYIAVPAERGQLSWSQSSLQFKPIKK